VDPEVVKELIRHPRRRVREGSDSEGARQRQRPISNMGLERDPVVRGARPGTRSTMGDKKGRTQLPR
jgi:hypothetical protein